MSIVVVGSVAFDTVQTPFGKGERVLGGAANYFALAASFFTNVKMVGVVGQDYPKAHLDFLKERNIDTAGIRQESGKTFHWTGEYGFDLNEAHTLKTELNVFSHFAPTLPEDYRDVETVFCANIDPNLQLSVLEQVRRPQLSALDTMNFWIEGKKDELLRAISRVQILFINESEIRQLAREHNVVKAAKAMHALGPKYVVIKRGEYGALLFQEGSCIFVPGYPLEDLFDPTGAGDTFAGGFLGWLDKHGEITTEHLKEAMIIGSVMASFTIEDFSFERLKRLTMDEIEQRCLVLQEWSATTSKKIVF